MTPEQTQGERLTTLAVVTRLASRVSRGDGPLGAIAEALGELAAAVEVERVVVAVDDQRLGRQVFTSARAPLGNEPVGLFGGPGTWTDPGGRLEHEEAELVTATVGVAVRALPHAELDIRPADTAVETLAAATARARAHGWGFTLAWVRFDDGDHSATREAALEAGLRAGDVVLPTTGDALAVILPAARDDEAAAILAAAVRAQALARCAFGLAQCPGDATDAARLRAIATRRLDEAIAARYPSSNDE